MSFFIRHRAAREAPLISIDERVRLFAWIAARALPARNDGPCSDKALPVIARRERAVAIH